jgi:hypothetical protein
MKIINLIFCLLVVLTATAQQNNSSSVCENQTKELKGKNETYVEKQFKGAKEIKNKKFSLSDPFSQYQDYEYAQQAMQYLDVNNKDLLDTLVEEIIYKNMKINEPLKKHDCIVITLFANHKGYIKEISIYYPDCLEIPITTYERFEKAVLKGDLKLNLDETQFNFKEDKWVGRWYGYYPQKGIE